MPAVKMPRLSVRVDDLIDLIEQYDSWGGSMPPDEAFLYRQRFADLKDRADTLLRKVPVENEHLQVTE